MMKKIVSLLAILALAGCAPYVLVPAGKVEIDGKVGFVVDKDWNGRATPEDYVLTMDGPALQSVIFNIAVEDGKTIYKTLDTEAKHNPLLALAGKRPDEVSYRFRKSMTEPEIMDLVAATLSLMYKAPVETAGLAPVAIDGKPGFRFDYATSGADGVRRKGLVAGAVVKDKLYLVNYIGTAAYHFDKHRDDVERLLATLSFKES